MSVKLGDKVKDVVSGLKGVAVARHIYLQGCNRITVQPPAKGSMLPGECTFDEPQLLILKEQKVKRLATEDNPGGPEKYSDVPKTNGNKR